MVFHLSAPSSVNFRGQAGAALPTVQRCSGFQGSHRLFLCLVVCFMVCACAGEPISTEYRRIGAEYHGEWFKTLPETPALNTVVEIKKLTIHMVSDRKDFDWEKAREKQYGIAAYANTRNEISILGKKIGGKIIVNQLVLGHEFNHILNFADPDIVDPDDRAAMDPSAGK